VAALIAGAVAGYALSYRTVVSLQSAVDHQSKQLEALTAQVARLERPSRVVPLAGGPAIDVSALAEQLSQRIRQEPPSAVAEPASGAADAGDRDLEPDTVAAVAEGQRLVDGALRSGQWTDEQADALRALIPRIGGEHHLELIRQLIVPINEGRVTYDGSGPPF
jgi:hypothetical protein